MKPLGRHDPRTAGRHRLIAVIGQGAMGRVLLGRAPDGRLVAVKMIHRHLAENPEFRARFRLEVQASQRVTGAYTAAVMDADPEAEAPWLASVFVPGPSLRDAIDHHGPMYHPDTSRVPAPLRPVVAACLDKNPAHRPKTEEN
ncbi:hypothetical protein [Nocardia sp. XZ_19_369]|uniref:hypothetical protein n=1 Tax=Nocardia sp. XZ_19_369 TaxID=2769487 RepID=UPI00188DD8BA|nr:hypothetical protein [Nocardia sp. XZ_19_369]